jgi:sodium pump decarboxylase gamma subunit
MNPIIQGLQVSVLGLVITFLALGLFILVIEVLKRLFPAKIEAQEEPESTLLVVETAEPGEEGELVAAITAAIYCAQAEKHGQLGDALSQGRGGWWSARGERKGRK